MIGWNCQPWNESDVLYLSSYEKIIYIVNFPSRTPWKINGWNLQNHPWKERKMIWTKPPWLCSMLIFTGVSFFSGVHHHFEAVFWYAIWSSSRTTTKLADEHSAFDLFVSARSLVVPRSNKRRGMHSLGIHAHLPTFGYSLYGQCR